MTHPDNAFYGHRRAILTAAGVAPNDVVHGHIQHGWMRGSGLMARSREIPWLPKLVWNKINLRNAQTEGHKKVVPIGSPFIYLPSIEQPLSLSETTLAYPHHSWDKAELSGDHNAYVRELQEREPGGVTVCLYWREFDNPAIRYIYEQAGFKVICHGHRSDEYFLGRAHVQLTRHTRIVTNRVGTAIWYAAYLKRNVEVYGPLFVAQETKEQAIKSMATMETTWPELFRPGGLDGDNAHELASTQLGAEFKRSPAELAEICSLGGSRAAGLAEHYAVHALHKGLGAIAVTRAALGSHAKRK